MLDITGLIMDDHAFRRRFAALDDLDDADELAGTWSPLAALPDVHAAAEEEILYPELIRRSEDSEDETLDAVRDQNEIRDCLHEAARHPVGSHGRWAAVRQARVANSNHMARKRTTPWPMRVLMPATSATRIPRCMSGRSRSRFCRTARTGRWASAA